MAQHGSIDRANNSPIWVTAQVNKGVNTANRDALFNNATPNGYVSGTTVGVYGVAANEIGNYGGRIPHTGWHLRTVGSGGRAGRVFHECLVAGGFSTATEDDTQVFVITHPASKSVNTNTSTTFTVVAGATPPGTTITYKWRANTGAGFADITDAGVYSNSATATLSISNTAGLTGVSYQVRVMATGAINVISANATLTVT